MGISKMRDDKKDWEYGYGDMVADPVSSGSTSGSSETEQDAAKEMPSQENIVDVAPQTVVEAREADV